MPTIIRYAAATLLLAGAIAIGATFGRHDSGPEVCLGGALWLAGPPCGTPHSSR